MRIYAWEKMERIKDLLEKNAELVVLIVIQIELKGHNCESDVLNGGSFEFTSLVPLRNKLKKANKND